MSTTLTLTPEQQAQLAPLLQSLQQMADQGQPGALVAQFYGGSARVVLMDQAKANRFNAAMEAAWEAE